MPKFKYTAKNRKSQTVRDTETAVNREELVSKLRSRGLFIVALSEITEGGGSAIASLFSKGRSKRSSVVLYDLTLFARNLSTTLSSGVTLLRSLEILSTQTESGGLSKILNRCSEDIRSGLSLSEAIAKYPKIFSSLWRGIIEVGEASGNLPFVLERLADYLDMRMEFERKIKSAMVYPTILLVVAAGVMFAFFKIILPKFVGIFTQFNVELPVPTQIVFGISSFLEKNFFVLLLGGFILGAALVYAYQRPEIRRWWDEYSLKLPIFGKMILISCMERYTSTMHILLDSGLPLVYTLETAAKSVGNMYLEKSIVSIKNKVKEGNPLSDEMARMQIFPVMVSEMTKIGEETGSLPDVFKKVASHYQKELTTKVERFVSAFEPIMIVVMGLLIGGLVISLFLPLFKISSLEDKR